MPNTVRVKEFLAGPVREFSLYDNVRSIPSLVDGFKVSQRKAVFGALKRGIVYPHDTVKVGNIASAISEVAAYHHGEGSMAGTVVGMAQTFPGANNINYFDPDGQFGSRLSPQAGASRYIFTRLTQSFRKLFPKDDDLILEHLNEDGQDIEPNYYLPILPNVLINGARGMGTGFATNICCYNPEDLRKYTLQHLEGKKSTVALVPWYRGYHGTVTRTATGQVVFRGKLEKVNSTKLRITELPVGTYLQDYLEHLIALMESGFIKDFDDNSTELSFDFTVTVPRTTGYLDEDELYAKFKLIGRETENFTVWTPSGKIRCFDSAEQLCDYFIDFRLTKYEQRRLALVAKYQVDLDWLNEKLRFVRFYLANAERFSRKTRAELEQLLTEAKFVKIGELLDIRIYQLTKDMIEKLESEIAEVEALVKHYQTTTATALYVKELKELKL